MWDHVFWWVSSHEIHSIIKCVIEECDKKCILNIFQQIVTFMRTDHFAKVYQFMSITLGKKRDRSRAKVNYSRPEIMRDLLEEYEEVNE